MEIKNQKLVGAAFDEARWIGDEIKPEIVVLHDTASRLDHGNAARYLRNTPPSAKTSVHFVVEVDGTVTQQVPTNRRANHAGKSTYHGRDWCNEFSIGIEIVNTGRLTSADGVIARSWFKEEFNIERCGVQFVETAEHGAGWWMDYPPEQVDAVIALLEALFAEPGNALKDIVAHWYVSPGRKVDVNPLFPLEQVRGKILGRDFAVEDVEATAVQDGMARVTANGDTLNMRRWPSFNPNVIARIPDGVEVPVLAFGDFGGRDWCKVLYGGQEGWVVSNYLIGE